jgi:hypothetical protein
MEARWAKSPVRASAGQRAGGRARTKEPEDIHGEK